MNNHKHIPVTGRWPIRLWEYSKATFLRDKNKIVQWDSKTALCKKCGILLRMPKTLDIANVFSPALCISLWMLLFAPIFNSTIPYILKTILGYVMSICLYLVVYSTFAGFCLAFGKWTVVDMEGQDVETKIKELRKEVKYEEKRYFRTRNGIVQLMLGITSFIIFLFIADYL